MAYDLSKVVVTSSPHIKADDDTRSLMLDVLIALVPALAVAIYTFGVRALIHVIIAMVSCAVFETIYNKIVKHENTVGDLSCFVTGVLIAFNIPVAAPLWLTVFGGLFGIVIVKMLFGGIGKNFMNPALGARAFLGRLHDHLDRAARKAAALRQRYRYRRDLHRDSARKPQDRHSAGRFDR